ncbi:TPA: FMN-binding protein [Clostridioides difficile]|uniref:FMN-binding protein n=1 Tax=Clostridioides difficile TaxID=1496 RepID=UPI00097FF728|nr:FMN-binding protein [Clostridioides difficile]MDV9568051.1 FMN-binding protein [Clostridioides difficile]MDV9585110.1 FMN-binding protein [Clostridioides difficile]MDV9613771.1 FMN-binding protein [Clostridioides difficile]MDV9625591.1 FMN-binding protein [Clostridioides difficile]MDV9629526.1 FMN-binding protein [Clostridioides difficile]
MKIHNKSSNKKKKYLKISITIFFVFICIIILIVSNLKPENLVVKDINIANIKNGIYTGSADNKLKATVSVEVNNGKIQNINILKHDNLLGKPAEKITTNIIKQQSLDVDAITSATYSSNTIRKAVENALRKGE